MDWQKILANVVGVAVSCAALQKAGLMGDQPDWASVGLGVLMCVVMNQIGLHQHKP